MNLQNTSESDMIYLTQDELIKIHDQLIKQFGGNSGILTPEKIDLCVKAPCRTVFGSVIYKNLPEKAAALIYEICKLHPFVDGNKRTAYSAADIFLRLNGYILSAETEEAVEITKELAKCTIDREATVKWMTTHMFEHYDNLFED